MKYLAVFVGYLVGTKALALILNVLAAAIIMGGVAWLGILGGLWWLGERALSSQSNVIDARSWPRDRPITHSIPTSAHETHRR